MQPQRSIAVPVLLTILICLILFGGGGYYLGIYQNQIAPTTTPTPLYATATPTAVASITPNPTASPTATPAPAAKTYSNADFGFSFSYPNNTTLTELTSQLSEQVGGQKSIHLTNSDYNVDIYVAKSVASGSQDGSYVIGLYRTNGLNSKTAIAKNTTLKASNFSFSLLDVNADPSYVSGFAKLTNTLVDVSFTSPKGSLVPYHQADLPKSALDLLASFKQL